jgi:hypothetical protein
VNEELFSNIYRDNVWSDPSSRSGPGSNLVQTRTICEALPATIRKYGMTSLLDIPCGDFFWMKEIKAVLGELLDRYIGGDIVEDVVKANASAFTDHKFSFGVYDIQRSPLPRVDVVFCRDCLVHFSYKDSMTSIRNIKRSGSKYVLATTFPGRSNRYIITGGWFPMNLEAFPFYVPSPLEIINEECTEYDGPMQINLWYSGISNHFR